MSRVQIVPIYNQMLELLLEGAQEEEDKQGKTCYWCHNLVPTTPPPLRCLACKTAVYCNRACRRAGWALHAHPCHVCIVIRQRTCTRQWRRNDGARATSPLPSWYEDKVNALRQRKSADFSDGAVLVFFHREAQILTILPTFGKIVAGAVDRHRRHTSTSNSTAAAAAIKFSEEEGDNENNMVLALLGDSSFARTTCAEYPSLSMCVLANSVYSPDRTSMLIFFKGTQWQFASLKLGAHDRPGVKVEFNYASDAHRTRTSRK